MPHDPPNTTVLDATNVDIRGTTQSDPVEIRAEITFANATTTTEVEIDFGREHPRLGLVSR